jgi:hypothetical protein
MLDHNHVLIKDDKSSQHMDIHTYTSLSEKQFLHTRCIIFTYSLKGPRLLAQAIASMHAHKHAFIIINKVIY